MPSIDVWGLNVYRGIRFGDLFDVWEARSDAPMLLAEYGADAFDARSDSVSLEAKADATRALTEAWMAESTARHDDGVARTSSRCRGPRRPGVRTGSRSRPTWPRARA